MMEDDSPVIYGTEFQSRALTSHTADTEQIRFFVGTQCLKLDVPNQIHEINFDDENNSIDKKIYLHEEGEIWYLQCPQSNPNLVATCYNKLQGTKCSMQATIWKLPPTIDAKDVTSAATSCGEETKEHLSLSPLTNIELEEPRSCNINRIKWHPNQDDQLVALSDTNFSLWHLNEGSAKLSSVTQLDGKGSSKFSSCSWNPHHNCNQIATCNDTNIKGWDLRTQQSAYTISHAHTQLVRDLDFNPNRQYYLATCADDCLLKFWDIRNCDKPLKSFKNHSHWVWSVRYNQSHDQLVLTSSSDWRVVLTNVVSLSSEPFGHVIDDDIEDESGDYGKVKHSEEHKPKDSVIAKYEEHEDSVYWVEWSSADPWVFASVSFDGRFVINKVPRQEKYKILL